jgi:acyl-coenzyme A synthetase/AMP-(fatty) acid ligase
MMLKRYLDAGGPIPPGTLYDCFKISVSNYRNREAIVDTFLGFERGKRRRRTFQQLYDDVNTIILNLLDLGIEPGDIVGDLLGNTMESVMLEYATAKLGAIYSYLHLDMPAAWFKEGLEQFLSDVKVYALAPSLLHEGVLDVYLKFKEKHPTLKHIFALTKSGEPIPGGTEPFSRLLDKKIWEKYSEQDIENLKPDINDLWMLWVTSATTGFPKLIALNALGPYACPLGWADSASVSCYDKLLLFGPFTGPTPRMQVATAHLKGAGFIMLSGTYSDEAACKITEEEKATLWGGHPILMVSAVNSPHFQKYDMSTLRGLIYAGAAIPAAVRYKLWDMGIKTYASTGAISGGFATWTGGDMITDKEVMCESYGKGLPGTQTKIVDEKGNPVGPGGIGEIAYRGVAFGAWRNPEYNKETYDDEGWEWDGDWVRLDELGNIYPLGRPENLMRKSGKLISPIELESVLYHHPKLVIAVVMGMPDKEVGQRVVMFAIPKPGETVTLEEIQSFLREYNVEEFKLPERLEFLAKPPLSAGGKIDYPFLSKLIEEKLKAERKI